MLTVKQIQAQERIETINKSLKSWRKKLIQYQNDTELSDETRIALVHSAINSIDSLNNDLEYYRKIISTIAL